MKSGSPRGGSARCRRAIVGSRRARRGGHAQISAAGPDASHVRGTLIRECRPDALGSRCSPTRTRATETPRRRGDASQAAAPRSRTSRSRRSRRGRGAGSRRARGRGRRRLDRRAAEAAAARRHPARRDPGRHRQRLRRAISSCRTTSPRPAASRVDGERTRRLELARLGGRPFVNVASPGLAPVAAARRSGLKSALGPLAYAAGALQAAVTARPSAARSSATATRSSRATPGR